MLPILGLLGTVVHFGAALSGIILDDLPNEFRYRRWDRHRVQYNLYRTVGFH